MALAERPSPLKVIETDGVDKLLALDADRVLYAPLLPNAREVAAILRSGKNVVTPVGWFWPGEKERAAMAAAAHEGGVVHCVDATR